MDRRSSSQKAYGTAGAAFLTALGRPEWLGGAPARKASHVLYLGPDKIRVSRLAIGLGSREGIIATD